MSGAGLELGVVIVGGTGEGEWKRGEEIEKRSRGAWRAVGGTVVERWEEAGVDVGGSGGRGCGGDEQAVGAGC